MYGKRFRATKKAWRQVGTPGSSGNWVNRSHFSPVSLRPEPEKEGLLEVVWVKYCMYAGRESVGHRRERCLVKKRPWDNRLRISQFNGDFIEAILTSAQALAKGSAPSRLALGSASSGCAVTGEGRREGDGGRGSEDR